MPPVDIEMLKSELGDIPSELKHLADNHIGPYYPFMKVLPMGFSWAFHLAHQAHVELARRCRPLVPHVRDRAPKLGGGRDGHNTAMLIYANNNNHLGVERDAVSLDQLKSILPEICLEYVVFCLVKELSQIEIV